MNIQAIKSDFLAKRNQLILLGEDASLLDSCNSLIDLSQFVGKSIFEIFDIFAAFETEVLNLKSGDAPFLVPMLEFGFEGQQYSLSLEFMAREDGPGFFLLMNADDDFSLRLRKMQQERNESVILVERIKEQEKSLKEYTAKLETVNNSLDRFAYIVSHDLKSPLRAIGNLATWIDEGIETGDHSELDDYLKLLKSRVSRMENLIEGILQYSRAGREHIAKEETALIKMLEELAASNFEKTDYELVLSPLLPASIYTQKVALHQVFSNLLSNVRKYGNSEFHRVEVEFSEDNDFYLFAVIDNGPGIDQRFHGKIFEIFQTLQSRDKFESTGIGLTIVKKIIEEQGGKIWIESAEGKGATFRFTWPKN